MLFTPGWLLSGERGTRPRQPDTSLGELKRDQLVAWLTFVSDGAATRIEMRTVFPTEELRDEAVEKYHAIEGGQQTLSNLAAYITEIVRQAAEG